MAVVTGAGRGMGKAIALRLAAAGANVAVTDIDLASAQSVAKEIGQTARAYQVDVASLADVEKGFAAITSELGAVFALVNNAGYGTSQRFLDTDPAVWERTLAVNFYGTLHCCRVVLPGMIERGGGRIVSISSDAAKVGAVGAAVYAGAKAAVLGFTRSLALEVARNQINVNAVCPGPTDTQFLADGFKDNPNLRDAVVRAVPLRRIGTPEDIAGMVVFLASDDGSWITGQSFSVSGGITTV